MAGFSRACLLSSGGALKATRSSLCGQSHLVACRGSAGPGTCPPLQLHGCFIEGHADTELVEVEGLQEEGGGRGKVGASRPACSAREALGRDPAAMLLAPLQGEEKNVRGRGDACEEAAEAGAGSTGAAQSSGSKAAGAGSATAPWPSGPAAVEADFAPAGPYGDDAAGASSSCDSGPMAGGCAGAGSEDGAPAGPHGASAEEASRSRTRGAAARAEAWAAGSRPVGAEQPATAQTGRAGAEGPGSGAAPGVPGPAPTWAGGADVADAGDVHSSTEACKGSSCGPKEAGACDMVEAEQAAAHHEEGAAVACALAPSELAPAEGGSGAVGAGGTAALHGSHGGSSGSGAGSGPETDDGGARGQRGSDARSEPEEPPDGEATGR